jgi:mono/diheme cytochrome c family protein
LWVPVWLVWSAGASAQTAAPTYTSEVEPILRRQCVGCHRSGDIAPFTLDTYDAARQSGRAIADATARRYMPPWKPVAGIGGPFAGARSLTNDEIATIAKWVEAGMPRGADRAAASPAERLPEWRLGAPDLIVTLDHSYTLSAGGPDVFRNFTVPIPVDSLQYVAAVDFSPAGARAIHHANLRFDPSTTSRELDAEDKEPGVEKK